MACSLSYEPPGDAAYALALVAALRNGGALRGGGGAAAGSAWVDSPAPAPAAAEAPDRAAALAVAVAALRARRRARRCVARAAAAERRAALAATQRAAPATAARAALQHPAALALLLRCALPACEPLGAALVGAADAPLPREAPADASRASDASSPSRDEGLLSGRRGGAARVAAPGDVPRLAALLAKAVAPPRAGPPGASGAAGAEASSAAGSPAAAVRTPGEPDCPPAAVVPDEATACQAQPCAAEAMAVDDAPPVVAAAPVATVTALPPPPLLLGYQRQLLCAAPSALRLWDKAPLEPVGPACRVAYLVLCPRAAGRAAASFCRELAAVYASMRLGCAAPAPMPPGWPDADAPEALPGLMLLDDDAGVLDVDAAGNANDARGGDTRSGGKRRRATAPPPRDTDAAPRGPPFPAAGPAKRPPGRGGRGCDPLASSFRGYAEGCAAASAALSASLRPCAGVVFLVAPRAGMLRALALAGAACANAERGGAGVTLHPLCLEALSLAAAPPQHALRPHALALHARAHRRPGTDVLADLAASDAAAAAAGAPMPQPGRLPPHAPGAPRPRKPPPLAPPYCLAAAAHLPPSVDAALASPPLAAPHLAAPWRLHVCYAPAGAAGTAVAWCAAGGTHLDADRVDAIVPAPDAAGDDVARALVDAVLRRACDAWAAVCGDEEDSAAQGGGRNEPADGLAITRLGAVPPAEAVAWRAALALPWRCGAARVTVCGVSGCVAAPLPPVGLPPPPPPPAATLVLLPGATGDDATSASAMVVSRASGGATSAAWWLAPPLSAGGAPRASCPLGVDILALHACCEAAPPAGGARRASPATPGEPTSDDAAAVTAAGAAAVPALAAALAALAACGAPVGAGAAAPPLPLHCGAAARAAGLLRLLHRLAQRAGPPV